MLCFRPNVLYKARDHGCAGCTAGGGDLYGYDITTLHKPRRLLWGIMNKCSVHFICRLSALPLFTVFTEHLNLLYNKKKTWTSPFIQCGTLKTKNAWIPSSLSCAFQLHHLLSVLVKYHGLSFSPLSFVSFNYSSLIIFLDSWPLTALSPLFCCTSQLKPCL